MRVLTYPELQNVQSIEEILGSSGRAVILFLTTGLSRGHWVGVFKRGNTLSFFDSYGLAPDAEGGWLSHDKLVELHEDVPLLHKLFKEAESRGVQTTYNKTAYQNPHDLASETCGRHVAVRLDYSDFTDAQYHALIEECKANTHSKNADAVVVLLTHHLIGK